MEQELSELTHQESAAFERAKTRHYVVMEVKQHHLESWYRQFCKSNSIPYVGISYHGKGQHLHMLVNDEETDISEEEHAEVMFDLFDIQRKLSPQALDEVRKAFERFRPSPYRNIRLHLAEDIGYVVVPHYVTEKLAASLFDIITKSGATLPDPHVNV